ncbi:hypothetical protein GCM10027047_26790 [Rhodococcus aerolatus]
MSDADLLPRYYAAVDAGELQAAAELFTDDAAFSFTLPGGVRRGRGRDGVAAYLAGRGDVQRAHVLARTARDRDTEFVAGSIVEDGTTTTGHFLATCTVDEHGAISAYQVLFDPVPPAGATTDGAGA